MKRSTERFVLWAAGAAAVLAGLGSMIAGAAAMPSVVFGAALAWFAQATLFWVLAERVFGGRLVPVYAAGMIARFALLAFAAFVLVPLLNVAAAPMLLTLAAVLFATTLLEPVFLAGEKLPVDPIATRG